MSETTVIKYVVEHMSETTVVKYIEEQKNDK